MKTISIIFWVVADKMLSALYVEVKAEGLYWKWLDSLQARAYKRRYYAVRRIANGK